MHSRRAFGFFALAGTLAGTLALAGCSRDLPLYPQAHALAGRVRLTGMLTADDARPLGTRVVDDADGVPVELLYGEQVVARTTTTDGVYRFTGVRPGGYRVRASIFGPVNDRTAALTIANSDVFSADTLSLTSSGDLYPAPNPIGDGSTIFFAVPDTEWVEVRVLDAKGDLVRALVHRRADPGLASTFWNGCDQAGVSVPGSLFWVTFESGADLRAQLLFK